MKVSLMVAQGVHTGKIIPINGNEFIIGRDPQCQLRPSSPAISKQHCALALRDGKVFVRDCGSTNGTFLNGEQIAGEREAKAGDQLRVGPLEFQIRLEETATKTSVPVKPAAKVAQVADTVAGNVATVAVVPQPAATPVEATQSSDDPDDLAAQLLGMDDGTPGTAGTVEQFNAESTTVMEIPALGADKGKPAAKKEEKKEHKDNANAAAEVLAKYMRRPRT